MNSENFEKVFMNARYAKQNNLDILLEYSETQGMFHFNFVTDKQKWIGQDEPSPYYIPIGYTNIEEYKRFREYAMKEGLRFYSPQSGVLDPKDFSSLADVEAVFGNFWQSGGIKNGVVVVDGIEVPTEKMQITNANIIEVEVGTNGYQGGDAGQGCRVYFCIDDLSSTYMNAKITGTSCGNAGKVEITLGGDSELDTFIEALEFAVEKLNKMKHGRL